MVDITHEHDPSHLGHRYRHRRAPRELAAERGQDVAAVLAEAVALLDSVIDIAGPDIAEDRRRLDEFKRTKEAVSLDDVKAWIASRGTGTELPRPRPRKFG